MAKKTGKLTRADLDRIVDGMSARDIFRSGMVNATEEVTGSERAESIFDYAAERQGYGAKALDRVSIGDTVYLSNLLGEALNMGTPKADSSPESQPSSDTGEYLQS
jgi:hypothetical protein